MANFLRIKSVKKLQQILRDRGQMAVTGRMKCFFIAYTYKGIYTMEIDFDPLFWEIAERKPNSFYCNGLLPVLKGGKVFA